MKIATTYKTFHIPLLQVVHNTSDTSYDELPLINIDVRIHLNQQHLLVTEVFKTIK